MKNSSFICGPFADVVERIEDFGTSLYFSQLYLETIQQHQDLILKLNEAKDAQDYEKIKELKKQIYFIESICSMDNFTELPFSEN